MASPRLIDLWNELNYMEGGESKYPRRVRPWAWGLHALNADDWLVHPMGTYISTSTLATRAGASREEHALIREMFAEAKRIKGSD